MNEYINKVNDDYIDSIIKDWKQKGVVQTRAPGDSDEFVDHIKRYNWELREIKCVPSKTFEPRVDIDKTFQKWYIEKEKDPSRIALNSLNQEDTMIKYALYKEFIQTDDFKTYVKVNYNLLAMNSIRNKSCEDADKITDIIASEKEQHLQIKASRNLWQRHFKVFRTQVDKVYSIRKEIWKGKLENEKSYTKVLDCTIKAQNNWVAEFERDRKKDLSNICDLSGALQLQRSKRNEMEKQMVEAAKTKIKPAVAPTPAPKTEVLVVSLTAPMKNFFIAPVINTNRK